MKRLELLNLNQSDTDILNKRIELHQRYSSISFRIVVVNDQEVIITVSQGDSVHNNTFDHSRLREIVKETFGDLIGSRALHISIKKSIEAPPDVVSPTWIKKKMNENNIRMKDIGMATGLAKNVLSDLLNDKRPLSNVTKAMFFYYFKSLK